MSDLRRFIRNILLLLLFAEAEMHAQCLCPSPLYDQVYDSLSGFTYVQNTPGALTAAGGQLNYLDPRGGDYHNLNDSIAGLSAISGNFSAACRFSLADGNSPGHMLIMLTETDIDAFTLQFPYPKSFNDALGIVIISPNTPPSDFCCLNPTDPANPWGFAIFSKRDTSLDYQTYLNTIHIPSLNTTYYLLLQRISPIEVVLSACYDSLYTQHLPGSPKCAGISPDLGPFNFLQQGVLTPASYHRFITAGLDNLTLCSGLSCEIQCPVTIEEAQGIDGWMEVMSNPSYKEITVRIKKQPNGHSRFSLTDLSGRIVFTEEKKATGTLATIFPGPLTDGIYFLAVDTPYGRSVKKVVYKTQ